VGRKGISWGGGAGAPASKAAAAFICPQVRTWGGWIFNFKVGLITTSRGGAVGWALAAATAPPRIIRITKLAIINEYLLLDFI
jgi:hypothetical protein